MVQEMIHSHSLQMLKPVAELTERNERCESVDKGAANERGCLSEQPNGVIPALTLTLAGSRYDNAKLSQARCAFVAGSFNGWVRRSFYIIPGRELSGSSKRNTLTIGVL